MKKIFGLVVIAVSLLNVSALSLVDAYESSYTQWTLNSSPLFDDTPTTNNYNFYDNNSNNYYYNNNNWCYNNSNNGYYTYDYDKDYYEAIKYISYNEWNCYNNDKWVKYCSARFSKYNYWMSTKYDCTYNYSYKWLFCKFPFEKQRRYISSVTNNSDSYFYSNWIKYIIWDNCYARMFVPENAHVTYNNSWECNWGYYRVGDYCQKTDTICGNGYRRVNGSCEKMYLPDNAYWINNSTDWQCYDGYRKNGNYCEKIYQNCGWGYRNTNWYCEKIYLPDNAYWINDGKDWSCNSWYYKIGDHCERYDQSDCGYWYYRINWYCQRYDDYDCGSWYYRVNWICQRYDYSNCGWGYQRTNGYCEQIYLPSHAHYSSNWTSWECDSWYYRDWNSCKISQDTVCSNSINYVCWTDNVTYMNECYANKNWVSIRYYGDCR